MSQETNFWGRKINEARNIFTSATITEKNSNVNSVFRFRVRFRDPENSRAGFCPVHFIQRLTYRLIIRIKLLMTSQVIPLLIPNALPAILKDITNIVIYLALLFTWVRMQGLGYRARLNSMIWLNDLFLKALSRSRSGY